MAIIELSGVVYGYDNKKQILDKIDYKFETGVFYAISGNSGAGKTTLLSLLSGLDTPTEGTVLFNGTDIKQIGHNRHRRNNVSLVFQNYNLIDYMTPIENIRLVDKKADIKLLCDLGLTEEECKRNVLKLSGGQQQRVAIARSLASSAPVILADEPTGNLDDKTAKEIIQILKTAAHERGKCVVAVTHSKQLIKGADVVLELKNGKLIK